MTILQAEELRGWDVVAMCWSVHERAPREGRRFERTVSSFGGRDSGRAAVTAHFTVLGALRSVTATFYANAQGLKSCDPSPLLRV